MFIYYKNPAVFYICVETAGFIFFTMEVFKMTKQEIMQAIENMAKEINVISVCDIIAHADKELAEYSQFYIYDAYRYECGCITKDSQYESFENLAYLIGYAKNFHNYVEEGGRAELRIVDGNICVVYKKEGDCPKCQSLQYDCSPEDTILQRGIYSHGLATGYGEKSRETFEGIKDKIARLIFDSQRKEENDYCVSWKTQCIGACGAFVRGKVTLASNIDLFSEINKKGWRVFDMSSWRAKGLFLKREQLDLSVWDHTEFWVQPRNIVGFWFKDWFILDHPQEVAELKSEITQILPTVKFFTVGRRHNHE